MVIVYRYYGLVSWALSINGKCNSKMLVSLACPWWEVDISFYHDSLVKGDANSRS